jgi:hypothetical protein
LEYAAVLSAAGRKSSCNSKKAGCCGCAAFHASSCWRRNSRRRPAVACLSFDGQGGAAPRLRKPKSAGGSPHLASKNRRMGGSAAETIRQPRDRLKGHPPERQHGAPSSAKSGTECPRRGAQYDLRHGMEARRAETPSAPFTTARPRLRGDAPILLARAKWMSGTAIGFPLRGDASAWTD